MDLDEILSWIFDKGPYAVIVGSMAGAFYVARTIESDMVKMTTISLIMFTGLLMIHLVISADVAKEQM